MNICDILEKLIVFGEAIGTSNAVHLSSLMFLSTLDEVLHQIPLSSSSEFPFDVFIYFHQKSEMCSKARLFGGILGHLHFQIHDIHHGELHQVTDNMDCSCCWLTTLGI